MKKLLALVCVCTMLFSSTAFAQDITITWNDTPIIYTQKPIIKNGTTFVPMKQTLEALGATVSWNAPTKTVIAKKGDIIVSTCPNSTTLMVTNNNKSQNITMDAPAYIENGTLFAPLRALLQPFQSTVSWDSTTNTAKIDSKIVAFNIAEKTEQKTMQNSSGVTVWKATLSYPEFQGDNPALTKINELISNDVHTSLSATENEIVADDINPTLEGNLLPYTFDCSYSITYLDNNTISLLLDYYELTGGAHGMPYRQAYTFDLNTGNQLQLKDILNTENADTFAKDAFKNNITQNPDNYFADATETVNSEYFAYDFYIQPNEIILFTHPYLLEPYANHYQPTTIDTKDMTLKISISDSTTLQNTKNTTSTIADLP